MTCCHGDEKVRILFYNHTGIETIEYRIEQSYYPCTTEDSSEIADIELVSGCYADPAAADFQECIVFVFFHIK